ncbi:unnamed protein product [Bursaphelenchus okinawaensis]|uniref:Peptidase C1A papain C-terminal domain-containing protein n=1 Tax=Bursaphelenchus okinawaensis TaxID=465554 RepID=A0A811JU52_9BILA|nr:unnamed protein product [Bursaphelenchus okinawaensis]CAG9084023.1 unnamed protein product [Bursaphelenchus okinawaensis]
MRSFVVILALIASALALAKHTPHLDEHLKLPKFAQELTGEALVDYINEIQTTWTATKDSRFFGMKSEEVRPFLGVLDAPEQYQNITSTHISIKANLPTDFDARKQWPKCSKIIGTIRDQSNCGSCWAVATVSAISDRICIHSDAKTLVHVSAQDLMSCCRNCGMGCNGGYPESAWDYYYSQGIVSGGQYGDTHTCRPYPFEPCAHHVDGTEYKNCPSKIEKTPACNQRCVTRYLTYSSDKHRSTGSVNVWRNEESIMQEVLTNGPVEAAFSVYEDFLTYKSGVYEHKAGRYAGGHAVRVIGWGVENGVKYWLVANSWNEGWGDEGTFKILRGKNHCGFEARMTSGIPKLT